MAHATTTMDEIARKLAPTPVSSFAEAVRSTDATVRELGFAVGPLEASVQRALDLLSMIDDPSAAPTLRALVEHREPRVRVAALRSLAWSGDRSDIPFAVAAICATSESLRFAAIGALAELGGAAAADALAGRLVEARGEELEQVIAALAWLRDERALPYARRLGPQVLKHSVNNRRNAAWALVRLGTEQDRLALRSTLLELADNRGELYQAFGVLANALADDHLDEIPEVTAWLVDHGLQEPHPAVFASTPLEPLGTREVAKLEMADLLIEPVDRRSGPQAKFGGQRGLRIHQRRRPRSSRLGLSLTPRARCRGERAARQRVARGVVDGSRRGTEASWTPTEPAASAP